MVDKWVVLYSIGYFRSWHHFLFLDNIEKIQEKFKLNFEYFWKYYGNGAFSYPLVLTFILSVEKIHLIEIEYLETRVFAILGPGQTETK